MEMEKLVYITHEEYDAAMAYLGLEVEDFPEYSPEPANLSKKQATLLMHLLSCPPKSCDITCVDTSLVNVRAMVGSQIGLGKSQSIAQITNNTPGATTEEVGAIGEGDLVPGDLKTTTIATTINNTPNSNKDGDAKDLDGMKKSRVATAFKSMVKTFTRLFNVNEEEKENSSNTKNGENENVATVLGNSMGNAASPSENFDYNCAIADNFKSTAFDGDESCNFDVNDLNNADQQNRISAENVNETEQKKYHTIYDPVDEEQAREQARVHNSSLCHSSILVNSTTCNAASHVTKTSVANVLCDSEELKGEDEETDSEINENEDEIGQAARAEAKDIYCLFTDEQYYGDRRALAAVLFCYFVENYENTKLFLLTDEGTLVRDLLAICLANSPSSDDVYFMLKAATMVYTLRENAQFSSDPLTGMATTVAGRDLRDISQFMAPFGCYYATIALHFLIKPLSTLTNVVRNLVNDYALEPHSFYEKETNEKCNTIKRCNCLQYQDVEAILFEGESVIIRSIEVGLEIWSYFAQQQRLINRNWKDQPDRLGLSDGSGVTTEDLMEKYYQIVSHSFMYNFLFNPCEVERVLQNNIWLKQGFIRSFKNSAINVPNIHNIMDNSIIGWNMQLNARTILVSDLFMGSFVEGRFIIASYAMDNYAMVRNIFANYKNVEEKEKECSIKQSFLYAHKIVKSLDEGEKTCRCSDLIVREASRYIIVEVKMEFALLISCEGLVEALCKRVHSYLGDACISGRIGGIDYITNDDGQVANSCFVPDSSAAVAYDKLASLIAKADNYKLESITQLIDVNEYIESGAPYKELDSDIDEYAVPIIYSTLGVLSGCLKHVLQSSSIRKYQLKYYSRPLPSILSVVKYAIDTGNDFTVSEDVMLDLLESIYLLIKHDYAIDRASVYVSYTTPSKTLRDLTNECEKCLQNCFQAIPSLEEAIDDVMNGVDSYISSSHMGLGKTIMRDGEERLSSSLMLKSIAGEEHIETITSVFSDTNIFRNFIETLTSNSLLLFADSSYSRYLLIMKIMAECAKNGNMRALMLSYITDMRKDNIYFNIASFFLNEYNMLDIDEQLRTELKTYLVQMLTGLAVDENFRSALRSNEKLIKNIYTVSVYLDDKPGKYDTGENEAYEEQDGYPVEQENCCEEQDEKVDNDENKTVNDAEKTVPIHDLENDIHNDAIVREFYLNNMLDHRMIECVSAITELSRILTLDTSNLIDFNETDYNFINLSLFKSLTNQGLILYRYAARFFVNWIQTYGDYLYMIYFAENKISKTKIDIEIVSSVLNDLTTVLMQLSQIIVPILPFVSVQTNLTMLERKYTLGPKDSIPYFFSTTCYEILVCLLLSSVSIFSTSASVTSKKVVSSTNLRTTALAAFALQTLQKRFPSFQEFLDTRELSGDINPFRRELKMIDDWLVQHDLDSEDFCMYAACPSDFCCSNRAKKYAILSCSAIAKFYGDTREFNETYIPGFDELDQNTDYDDNESYDTNMTATQRSVADQLKKSVVKKTWDRLFSASTARSLVKTARIESEKDKVFMGKISRLLGERGLNVIDTVKKSKRWSRVNICKPGKGKYVSKIFADYGDFLGAAFNKPGFEILVDKMAAFNAKARVVRGVSNETVSQLLRYLASSTSLYLTDGTLEINKRALSAAEELLNKATEITVAILYKEEYKDTIAKDVRSSGKYDEDENDAESLEESDFEAKIKEIYEVDAEMVEEIRKNVENINPHGENRIYNLSFYNILHNEQ